jgi:lambda family phage minor tail protein L
MSQLIDLYKLSHEEIVDLYTLDLSRWGGAPINFINQKQSATAVQWNNRSWIPWAFEASGFEYQGRGQAPQPKIVLSNLLGEVSSLCKQYRDLSRCDLIRNQVFADNLLLNNTTRVKPAEIWRVDRKVNEDANMVTFSLDNALNVEGVRIPGRRLLANNCVWLAIGGFKGPYCQYSGNATTCDGRLGTCRGLGNAARYGGAPAVDNQRQG